MTDRDLNNISEQEFDALLEQSLSQFPPPDNVIMDVTPWRRAMKWALAGLAFTTITLNFLYLNYILPTIGIVLLLLGFRSLRRENRWFTAGFVLTLLRAAEVFTNLILYSTIWQEAVFSHPAFAALPYISSALVLLTLFCLWRALLAAQRKAGLESRAGSAVALMVWYVIILLLAMIRYSGGIVIMLLILVSYIFILRSLYKLSKQLDAAGYAIQPARVHIPDKALVLALFVITAAGILIGTFFFNKYPMAWTPVQPQAQTQETETVRNELEALGVPEHILDDLSEEDLLACGNAVRILQKTEEIPMNDGRKVSETVGNHTTIYTVFDVRELHVTSIAIELSELEGHWKVIHYFEWVTTPDFIGTEAVKILPAYYFSADDYAQVGEITGSLFCRIDDVPLTADYAHLFEEASGNSRIIYAAFSFPKQGEHHRGYISYEVLNRDEYCMFDSLIQYTHQRSYRYPTETALSDSQDPSLFSNDAFVERWDALQFFPIEGKLF